MKGILAILTMVVVLSVAVGAEARDKRDRPLSKRQMSEKILVLETAVESLSWQLEAFVAWNLELTERARKLEWKVGLVLPACDGEWLWQSMCVQWPEQWEHNGYGKSSRRSR